MKNIKHLFLPSRSLWILILPVLLGVVIALAWDSHYQDNIASLKTIFHNEKQQKGFQIKIQIESNLKRLYRGLRTIARLPDVRALQNTQLKNDKSVVSIQELYNNMAADLEISEVYITLRDFSPGQINLVTGKEWQPLLMFDELIIGKTRLSTEPVNKNGLIKVEEIEQYEYNLIANQIAWFIRQWPNESSIEGLNYPAISGEEVITCDNSKFDPLHPDDKDRSGIVYSVPFYNQAGNFSGVVSGVVLRDVLRSWLPDSDYEIVNSRYGFIASKKSGELTNSQNNSVQGEHELIYSEQLPLNFIDGYSSWVLRSDVTNTLFWEQAIVQSEKKLRVILYAVDALFIILFIIFLYNNARYKAGVKKINANLENRIQKRTHELTLSREQSEKNSRYYNSILTNMVESLITMNSYGIITAFNPAAENMFGYKSDEVIGQRINMLMPLSESHYHDSYIREYLKRNQPDSIGINREIFALHKKGFEFPIEISLTEVSVANQILFIGTIHDIRQRVETEKNLLAARDAAESAVVAKSEFLSTMSHEIRTPMNGVLGMIQLIKDTELTNEQRDYVDVISNSGQVLLGIINDILDFSKIEAGELKVCCTTFNLEQIVFEVFQLLASKIKQKNIHFIFNYSPECPTYVYGDPDRIRQVVTNLVGNAIKFTEHGHIYIVVKQIHKVNSTCTLRLEVQDTGPGISEKAIPVLFDSFTQADSSTTRHYGGTGLGLAISKQIVELMGGDIGVDSTLDIGSTFWVTLTLPEHDVDKDCQYEIDDSKILIVDNYDFSRAQLETQLSGIGVTVTAVSSSESAFAEILKDADFDGEADRHQVYPYNIIIIDSNIGDTAIAELIKKIRVNKKLTGLGIILLSSLLEFDNTDKYSEAGVNAYIARPVLNSVLYKIVNEVIENNDKLQQKLITLQSIKDIQQHTTTKRLSVNGSILIVDDNDINIQVVKVMLDKLGVSFQAVFDGKQAIKRWQESHFDLILMDCQMPVMDGFLATAKIRNIEQQHSKPAVIIIALTANVLEGDREECIKVGMDDFLTKPIEVEALEAMLKKWLSNKIIIEQNGESHIPTFDVNVVESDQEQQPTLDYEKIGQLQELMGDGMNELVDSYVAGSIEKLDKMQQALNSMNSDEMHQLAHGLKGSSGNVGAKRMMELSEKIEMLAKQQQLDKAGDIVDELLVAFAETKLQIKSVVNK